MICIFVVAKVIQEQFSGRARWGKTFGSDPVSTYSNLVVSLDVIQNIRILMVPVTGRIARE